MLALAAGIQHPRQVQTPTPCLHFQKTPCLPSPCLLGALPPHEWPRLVLPRPWFIGWEPQPARCKPLAQGGHACPRGDTPMPEAPLRLGAEEGSGCRTLPGLGAASRDPGSEAFAPFGTRRVRVTPWAEPGCPPLLFLPDWSQPARCCPLAAAGGITLTWAGGHLAS